jgi:predicted amidohydrolase|tara:strand:+ start:2419 stop:3294 length:876 start_codon:yes stop_codon:yes gene_type:complete
MSDTKATMRFAGAQIPVTRDLQRNVETIKKSIDWAIKNKCDYLITPEGSLTGYFPEWETWEGRTFKDVDNALCEVEDYAGNNGMGLVLGTMWKEQERTGVLNRNQQRYYDQNGQLIGTVCKQYVIAWDAVVPGHYTPLIHLPDPVKEDTRPRMDVKVVGMLCNDLWGSWWLGKENIGRKANDMGADLLIHSSNGARGLDPIEDDVHDKFHTGCLHMMSYAADMPLISVDNCITMHGDESFTGPTSSPSGVWHKEQLVKVPRVGTQHFYYDFVKGEIEKESSITFDPVITPV